MRHLGGSTMQLRSRARRRGIALAALACLAAACGRGSGEAPLPLASPALAAAVPPPSAAEEPLPPPAFEEGLPEGARARIFQSFTGDLDKMVERRFIRAGVPYSRTFYFVDKGVQRGVAYEMGHAFEEQLNRKLRTKDARRVRVIFVVVPRDQLARALAEGKVDLVVAQVTVRPELQAIVDFTRPTRTNVSEVVVTGPGAPPVASVEDLSGKDVYARKDSKYWQSLVSLNERLKAKGKPPVAIREIPGNLEDEDLLEMTNAGLIPIVVVDDYLAAFWKKILPNVTVHDEVALRTGGSLAVAIRKHSPRLAKELNAFLARNGLGTTFGNVIAKRYLSSTDYVTRAASESERRKLLELVDIFRKYGDRYRLDYLLMAAQGYQESKLDQSAKSRVGAIGVMQVMPATAKELNVGDVRQVDANIHAGVKYVRFMVDEYLKDEPMDELNRELFAFACYNAGPSRVQRLRREAKARGLDPNVWFGNVEQIASERVGRETVTYVANIYKYYVAYRLVVEERARRDASRKALAPGAR
jgi:membrane-bound lytic murein transglycosylase MltF